MRESSGESTWLALKGLSQKRKRDFLLPTLYPRTPPSYSAGYNFIFTSGEYLYAEAHLGPVRSTAHAALHTRRLLVRRSLCDVGCAVNIKNAVEVVHLVLVDACDETFCLSRYGLTVESGRLQRAAPRAAYEADLPGNGEASLGFNLRAQRPARDHGIDVGARCPALLHNDDAVKVAHLICGDANAILCAHGRDKIVKEPLVCETCEGIAIDFLRTLAEERMGSGEHGKHGCHTYCYAWSSRGSRSTDHALGIDCTTAAISASVAETSSRTMILVMGVLRRMP